jgi:predicted PurR-regulated permease PerM
MPAQGPVQTNESAPEQENRDPLLRRIAFLLSGLFAIALVYLMSVAQDFLVPVVMATLIAMTFRPFIRWLAQRGIAPPISAFALAMTLLFGGLTTAYMVSGPLAGWVAGAPEMQRAFVAKMKTVTAPLKRVAQITETLKSAGAEPGNEGVQKVVVSEPAIPALLWFATYPAGYMFMFVGSVVLSLFLMASGNLIYERIIHAMPTLTDKKKALRLMHAVEREVSGYLFTLTAINAGVGIAIGTGLWFLGMSNSLVWGLLAFVLNFIPYAGPLAGACLVAISAIVTFNSLGYALLAPALYTLVLAIENQLVSPYVLSRRLEINSISILLAFAFFAWVWGIGGIIVSVPLLVTLRVFALHVDRLKIVGDFLAETSPALAEDTTRVARNPSVQP